MSLIVTKDIDLIIDIKIQGGKVSVSYGDIPLCKCIYSVSQTTSSRIQPLPPQSDHIKIVGSDTKNTSLNVTVEIQLVNRITKEIKAIQSFDLFSEEESPSGFIDAIEVPIRLVENHNHGGDE